MPRLDESVVYIDGLDLCVTTVPTKHAQPLYPYMGNGIIDYLGRYWHGARITSDGGDMRSLSGRGRAWIGGHDCLYRAPDTPLVPRACGM